MSRRFFTLFTTKLLLCALVLGGTVSAWGARRKAESKASASVRGAPAAPDTIGPQKAPVRPNTSGIPWEWIDFSQRSPLVTDASAEGEFCARWNPDFVYRGNRCCPTVPDWVRMGRGRRAKCGKSRIKYSYCSEMTDEQKHYLERAQSGKVADPLVTIGRDLVSSSVQPFCGVNDGFLAWGRPLVPSKENRVLLRRPERCIFFGTDPMIGMIEWVGRQVNARYPAAGNPNVRVIVGDIAAPRGGCISGIRGRRAHASHTSGQDVDIAYLVAKNQRWAPDRFHGQFEPETMWWYVQQYFKNPFACIKVMFLDRKLIRKLERVAQGDPEWEKLRPLIQHARGHRNHMHIRVGVGPGQPGCPVTDKTPTELPEELHEDEGEASVLDGEGSGDAPTPVEGSSPAHSSSAITSGEAASPGLPQPETSAGH